MARPQSIERRTGNACSKNKGEAFLIEQPDGSFLLLTLFDAAIHLIVYIKKRKKKERIQMK